MCRIHSAIIRCGDAGFLRKLIELGEVFWQGLALQMKLHKRLAVTRKLAIGIDTRLVEIAKVKDDLAL